MLHSPYPSLPFSWLLFIPSLFRSIAHRREADSLNPDRGLGNAVSSPAGQGLGQSPTADAFLVKDYTRLMATSVLFLLN